MNINILTVKLFLVSILLLCANLLYANIVYYEETNKEGNVTKYRKVNSNGVLDVGDYDVLAYVRYKTKQIKALRKLDGVSWEMTGVTTDKVENRLFRRNKLIYNNNILSADELHINYYFGDLFDVNFEMSLLSKKTGEIIDVRLCTRDTTLLKYGDSAPLKDIENIEQLVKPRSLKYLISKALNLKPGNEWAYVLINKDETLQKRYSIPIKKIDSLEFHINNMEKFVGINIIVESSDGEEIIFWHTLKNLVSYKNNSSIQFKPNSSLLFHNKNDVILKEIIIHSKYSNTENKINVKKVTIKKRRNLFNYYYVDGTFLKLNEKHRICIIKLEQIRKTIAENEDVSDYSISLNATTSAKFNVLGDVNLYKYGSFNKSVVDNISENIFSKYNIGTKYHDKDSNGVIRWPDVISYANFSSFDDELYLDKKIKVDVFEISAKNNMAFKFSNKNIFSSVDFLMISNDSVLEINVDQSALPDGKSLEIELPKENSSFKVIRDGIEITDKIISIKKNGGTGNKSVTVKIQKRGDGYIKDRILIRYKNLTNKEQYFKATKEKIKNAQIGEIVKKIIGENGTITRSEYAITNIYTTNNKFHFSGKGDSLEKIKNAKTEPVKKILGKNGAIIRSEYAITDIYTTNNKFHFSGKGDSLEIIQPLKKDYNNDDEIYVTYDINEQKNNIAKASISLLDIEGKIIQTIDIDDLRGYKIVASPYKNIFSIAYKLKFNTNYYNITIGDLAVLKITTIKNEDALKKSFLTNTVDKLVYNDSKVKSGELVEVVDDKYFISIYDDLNLRLNYRFNKRINDIKGIFIDSHEIRDMPSRKYNQNCVKLVINTNYSIYIKKYCDYYGSKLFIPISAILNEKHTRDDEYVNNIAWNYSRPKYKDNLIAIENAIYVLSKSMVTLDDYLSGMPLFKIGGVTYSLGSVRKNSKIISFSKINLKQKEYIDIIESDILNIDRIIFKNKSTNQYISNITNGNELIQLDSNGVNLSYIMTIAKLFLIFFSAFIIFKYYKLFKELLSSCIWIVQSVFAGKYFKKISVNIKSKNKFFIVFVYYLIVMYAFYLWLANTSIQNTIALVFILFVVIIDTIKSNKENKNQEHVNDGMYNNIAVFLYLGIGVFTYFNIVAGNNDVMKYLPLLVLLIHITRMMKCIVKSKLSTIQFKRYYVYIFAVVAFYFIGSRFSDDTNNYFYLIASVLYAYLLHRGVIYFNENKKCYKNILYDYSVVFGIILLHGMVALLALYGGYILLSGQILVIIYSFFIIEFIKKINITNKTI